MTAQAPTADPGSSGPGRRHYERANIYLITNTAVTGGLGVLFWLVAARLAPEAQVGPAVAASSLLLALAFSAQLNLPTALSRFLPSADDSRRSMALFCYQVSFGVGAVCGVVLIGLTVVLGGHLFNGGGLPLILVLAIFLPLWTIFAMEDSILIAARRSALVPIENALAALAKFAVLPLAVGMADGSGILLAWVLPIVIAIPIVNYVLFTRVLGRPAHPAPMADRRGFVTYALRDFPGTTLSVLAPRLIPVLIVAITTKQAGAVIGLPWSILTVAALTMPTLSQALLVELSHRETDTSALLRRANRLIFTVVFPITVVCALLARPVLAIAGHGYASQGAPVLAWGTLAMVPAAVVETRLALLRFQGRVSLSSWIQAVRAFLLLGGVVVLLALRHSSGIGVVLLIVNAATALLGTVVTRPSRRRASFSPDRGTAAFAQPA